AIVLMAAATYLTRIVGFLALRNRTLSKRAVTVMSAPGCVLDLGTGHRADGRRHLPDPHRRLPRAAQPHTEQT
ncbi:hypothetical protein C7E17_26845, partial [Stenotrophomonas maltophilia]